MTRIPGEQDDGAFHHAETVDATHGCPTPTSTASTASAISDDATTPCAQPPYPPEQ
jgi:hypothetical protein